METFQVFLGEPFPLVLLLDLINEKLSLVGEDEMFHQFLPVAEHDILQLRTESAAKFGFFGWRGCRIDLERGLQMSVVVAEMVFVLLLVPGLGWILVGAMALGAVQVLDHLLDVLLPASLLWWQIIPT